MHNIIVLTLLATAIDLKRLVFSREFQATLQPKSTVWPLSARSELRARLPAQSQCPRLPSAMPILELLYLFNISLLATYGLHSLFYTGLYWRTRRHSQPLRQPRMTDSDPPLPQVLVQLPVYNERHVIVRLIDAVVDLDWPASQLHIQVLDDSTDDTSQLIAAALAKHQGRGLCLEHVQRCDRTGYKAGALQWGLARSQSDFIAIFDADFIPQSDFLRRTMPAFSDPSVGCVQTRWDHVNPNNSLLTTIQALGIDGHFVVEQSGRHQLGAFMNFNGTGGIWRRAAMEAAGGWQGDTLTEDLDLSYRTQFAGWQIAYQPDVLVPAELPVQVDAFKRQQFRWAKGSIQTARKLMRPLWQTTQPTWKKLLGTLHLTNYAVHPLMLINLLLLLPVTFSHSVVLKLAPIFTLATLGPPLMYWAAMAERHVSRGQRLWRLVILMALGTGLSVNNTRAVLEALIGIPSGFMRTPKFAANHQAAPWQSSNYALPQNPTVWIELGLALYALALLVYSILLGKWWVTLWLLLYASGYGYIAGLVFFQTWERGRAQAKRQRQIACQS